MFDFHDPVVLSIEVRNSAGALENAGAVVCTVTLPDDTTATPTVVNGSAGVYTVTYTPTVAGRHGVSWVATGANASAFTDVFDVRVVSGTQIVSLADAKATLNFTGTDNDEELREVIEDASDLIDRLCGPVVPRSVIEECAATAGLLFLTCAPALEVTAITSATGAGSLYAVADLTVASPDSAIVRLIDGSAIASDIYTVTYTAGRPEVPRRFVRACKLLVQHMWETQRGSSSPGRKRGDTTDVTSQGSMYTLPNRVLELLQLDTVGPLVG